MPGARRGCQNNNRNDIAHINLGFFAALKHVDILYVSPNYPKNLSNV